MSDTGNPFFTFPLCLLAMPASDHKRRLQIIVSHTLRRAGTASIKLTEHDVREYLSKRQVSGYDGSEHHMAIVKGAEVCNVEIHGFKSIVKEANDADFFVLEHQQKHGAGPLVFISGMLLWGCHNDDDPPWREFSTLCGINSMIGFKTAPVLIRRTMILARQLGYKTPAVLRAEQKTQGKAVKPMTVKQLRDTLDRLEAKGLILRCPAGSSNIYFANKGTREELREAVRVGIETRKKIETYRHEDRQFLARASGGPAEGQYKRKPASKPKKGPVKYEGPDEGQTRATDGAKAGPAEGPVKEKPSMKCLSGNASQERASARDMFAQLKAGLKNPENGESTEPKQ